MKQKFILFSPWLLKSAVNTTNFQPKHPNRSQLDSGDNASGRVVCCPEQTVAVSFLSAYSAKHDCKTVRTIDCQNAIESGLGFRV